MSDAVERLISSIRKLAVHEGNARHGCEIYVGRGCTCGLSDILDELEQALQAFQRELAEVLEVAIARGEKLGIVEADEDYRERLAALKEAE